MKAKLQRLAQLGKENAQRAGATVAVALLTAGPAMAQAPAQPDVEDVVAYILAAAVTIALIGNAKLIIRASSAIFRWVGAMIR